MRDDKEKLMDPAINDLIPGGCGEAVEEPPELSPDYEDRPRPAPKSNWITDELERTKAEPCSIGPGLALLRSDSGQGLRVFKLGMMVRDIMDLDIDELRTIKGYLEKSK